MAVAALKPLDRPLPWDSDRNVLHGLMAVAALKPDSVLDHSPGVVGFSTASWPWPH